MFRKDKLNRSNLKNYMKIKEAAEYIGVTPATLRRWDKLGQLKAKKHPINKYRLYKKKELDYFLSKIKGE